MVFIDLKVRGARPTVTLTVAAAILVGLLVACAETAVTANPAALEKDGDLFVLDDQTFDDFAKIHSHLIVYFYAPWCSHCKAARLMLLDVASRLRDSAIVFAKVDAVSPAGQPPQADDGTEQGGSSSSSGGSSSGVARGRAWVGGVATAEKFDIRAFPTLRLLHYGRVNDHVVLERDADALGRQLEHLVRMPLVELETVADTERAVLENKESMPTVLACYLDGSSGAHHSAPTFTELGEAFRGIIFFFQITAAEVCAHFNITNNFVIVRPVTRDLVPTEGTPLPEELGAAVSRRREPLSYMPSQPRRPAPIGQRVRLSWLPRLRELSSEIVVFDGDAREENLGQRYFSRDKIYSFISLHAFDPIGILTERNRNAYNQRAPALLMMFVEHAREATLTPSSAPPKRSAEGSCDPHQQDGGQCQEGPPVGATSGQRPAPSLRYFANRFKRLARRPQFHNYSFLFVDPLQDAQIFSSFGFDAEALAARRAKMGNVAAASPEDEVEARRDPSVPMIGVLVGHDKYRYPYNTFDVALLEQFLTDINLDKINTFVKSEQLARKNPKPGAGLPLMLVYDNFDDVVSRDFERDALVLFASEFDPLSRRAAEKLRELAAAEKGNEKLVIGIFDAMHNDPPPNFQFAELPSIYFCRAADKRAFFSRVPRAVKGLSRRRAGSRPGTTPPSRRPQRRPRFPSHMPGGGGTDDADGATGADGASSLSSFFKPFEYGASEYTTKSFAEFAAQHASFPLRSELVPKPDGRTYLPKEHHSRRPKGGGDGRGGFTPQHEPGRVQDLYDASGNYLGGGKRSYTFDPSDKHSERLQRELREKRGMR